MSREAATRIRLAGDARRDGVPDRAGHVRCVGGDPVSVMSTAPCSVGSTTTFDALDDFAGPGGWDEGARMLGLRTLGIEHDLTACRTAKAAGHARICADVTTIPTTSFRGFRGYLGSPPCQAWSMAGNRLGEADWESCHTLVDRMAAGDDSTDWREWADPRSPLVAWPVARIRDMRPEWVALEEVPQVAPLWEHIAHVLRGWGYSAWTGDLCAADYGVPQTRTRRILIASRVRSVGPPPPTHTQHPDDADLFGTVRHPWVSWGEALGFTRTWQLEQPRGRGMVERHGPRAARRGDQSAPTVSTKCRSWVLDRRTNSKGANGTLVPSQTVADNRPAPTLTTVGVQSQMVIRGSNRPNATIRAGSEPAPTMLFGNRGNDVRVYPAGETTPGCPEHAVTRSTDSRLLEIWEAGVLQSFPADYPWQGSRTKQGQQVGNAVPPMLAAHVIAAATGIPLPSLAGGVVCLPV